MRAALKAPTVAEVLRQKGAVAEPTTPEALDELGKNELLAWGAVVNSTGATLD